MGVVPEDDDITVQMYQGVSKLDWSMSYKSAKMIANNIVSGDNSIFDCTQKYKGFIGNIRKKQLKVVAFFRFY